MKQARQPIDRQKGFSPQSASVVINSSSNLSRRTLESIMERRKMERTKSSSKNSYPNYRHNNTPHPLHPPRASTKFTTLRPRLLPLFPKVKFISYINPILPSFSNPFTDPPSCNNCSSNISRTNSRSFNSGLVSFKISFCSNLGPSISIK